MQHTNKTKTGGAVMSVNYSLIENRLTSGPGDYYAKVNPISTADVENDITEIKGRYK